MTDLSNLPSFTPLGHDEVAIKLYNILRGIYWPIHLCDRGCKWVEVILILSFCMFKTLVHCWTISNILIYDVCCVLMKEYAAIIFIVPTSSLNSKSTWLHAHIKHANIEYTQWIEVGITTRLHFPQTLSLSHLHVLESIKTVRYHSPVCGLAGLCFASMDRRPCIYIPGWWYAGIMGRWPCCSAAKCILSSVVLGRYPGCGVLRRESLSLKLEQAFICYVFMAGQGMFASVRIKEWCKIH